MLLGKRTSVFFNYVTLPPPRRSTTLQSRSHSLVFGKYMELDAEGRRVKVEWVRGERGWVWEEDGRRGEYVQNALCEILKEFMKILVHFFKRYAKLPQASKA